MAQNNKNARQSFYEVVFHGKPKVVRAFLSGLLMGAGNTSPVFYNYDEGVEQSGKVGKLVGKVGLQLAHVHVIVDAATSAYVKKMTKAINAATGLEIASHRSIRSATMDFEYHAFARRYDDEILGLLNDLPDGLKLKGFQHEVKLDPDAKGVEAYTPSHHFEATGKGSISGRIDLLIELKRRARDYPLIEAEEIRLSMA